VVRTKCPGDIDIDTGEVYPRRATEQDGFGAYLGRYQYIPDGRAGQADDRIAVGVCEDRLAARHLRLSTVDGKSHAGACHRITGSVHHMGLYDGHTRPVRQ